MVSTTMNTGNKKLCAQIDRTQIVAHLHLHRHQYFQCSPGQVVHRSSSPNILPLDKDWHVTFSSNISKENAKKRNLRYQTPHRNKCDHSRWKRRQKRNRDQYHRGSSPFRTIHLRCCWSSPVLIDHEFLLFKTKHVLACTKLANKKFVS